MEDFLCKTVQKQANKQTKTKQNHDYNSGTGWYDMENVMVEDLPVILADRPVLCSALTSVRKATGENKGEERWRRGQPKEDIYHHGLNFPAATATSGHGR